MPLGVVTIVTAQKADQALVRQVRKSHPYSENLHIPYRIVQIYLPKHT